MFDPNLLSANIRKYRRKKGVSQGDLAALVFVSTQAVSKWECGVSVPDVENLCFLASALDVSVDVLLGREKNNKKTMIAIDGGGSKTEFVLFDEEGNILENIVSGPSNPNSIGMERAISTIQNGINRLLSKSNDVSGIFIGASGFLTGNNAKEIMNILKKEYPYIKIKCDSDIANVIASATEKEKCIAVICGTGSVVFAKEKDKMHQLTGWGYLLSKSGSGYDIGRDGLYAALQEREGLGEKTLITPLIEEKLGGTALDNLDVIYKNDQSFIASFSRLVLAAGEKGDKIAIRILSENAKRLAYVINHASLVYDCGRDVIISGGMVEKDNIFIKELKENLKPDLEIIIPEFPQVFGACILCAKMCQVDTEELLQKLMSQYKKGNK